MITFKQYLLEADHGGSELVKILERDCAQFFRESNNQGLLLRGMRLGTGIQKKTVPGPDDEPVEFFIRDVRKDREPSSSSKSTHNKLNRWFQQHFDIKARSEAIFCVGDSQAGVRLIKQYGDPYVVFPIGAFRYIWSPLVTDLYNDTAGIDFDEEDLGEFMDKKLYTDKRLETAVKARNEIMIDCSKYYAFPHHYHEKLKRWLGML